MESQNLVLLAVASIGFISLCKSIFKFLVYVKVSFFRPPRNLKRYGSWAVITGCTDGIGKALAFELASKGLNLVLVGRNPSKLEATSTEIQERHGEQVEIRIAAVDLAECRGAEISKILGDAIGGLDIGILINNAGSGYPYPRFLHEVDLELMESILRVNIEATTWLTRAVLPGMLRKKKGAIVNIGSGSSCVTSSYPLFSIYAATKAYIAMLSRSMALEYNKQGIDIQCQVPLLVATKMTAIKKSSLFIPTPKTYSKASVRWIGYDKICLPYWPHCLQAFALQMLPESIIDQCLLWYFHGVRVRGMKKDARIAKGQR